MEERRTAIESILNKIGIREGIIEQLLKAPQEIEEAEIRCIDEQAHLDGMKRENLESARLILQQAEFDASALAFGLDDPKTSVVKGRNAEIRKIELGRFLSREKGLMDAQEKVNEIAKRMANVEAYLAKLEAALHGRQNALRANIALAQLLGGRDD